MKIAEQQDFQYALVDDLGKVIRVAGAIEYHVQKILELPLINSKGISQKKFKVVVDGVNSSGGDCHTSSFKSTRCNYCYHVL